MDAETEAMADAEAFEIRGGVALVDVGVPNNENQAERDRVRASRLEDVMIILEANAAAIAAAVRERLQGEDAGAALDDATLVLEDHDPAFTARFHPAVANGADKAALGQHAEALGAALEAELLAAIQSRVSGNRLFKPAIRIDLDSPPIAPLAQSHSPRAPRAVAGAESRQRPLKQTVSGRGRFWLVLGFLLVAIVLVMAGYLISDQLL